MKERLYISFILFIEILFFILINLLLQVPTNIIIRTGLIWFCLSAVFKHYRLQTILIWDEFENLFKALISYVSVITINYYPQENIILESVIIGFLMVAFDMVLNRQCRIIFRDKIARKTLIIGTSNDAYYIHKVANRNRFALTKVDGFIKINEIDVC